MNPVQLDISKDRFKFSAAHMTIFPDGHKEALHGHNYGVHFSAELKKSDFKSMVDFSLFKKILGPLCEKLDERVLIATRNPFVTIHEKDGEIEIIACKKRYVFPSDEVVLLDIDNVTVENLCRLLAEQFQDQITGELRTKVSAIEISIEETAGQSCSIACEIA